MHRAAERAGVGVRTLRRWLTEDTHFQADYAVARRALYDTNMNRLRALQTRAVETLESLMEASVSPAVRLGAARTVVELAVHHHDAETILHRLDEIEALAMHFLLLSKREHGGGPRAFTAAAVDALRKHPWPGRMAGGRRSSACGSYPGRTGSRSRSGSGPWPGRCCSGNAS